VTYRILLGIPDAETASDVAALAGEGGELEVIGTAGTADELATAVGRGRLDAVLIHEDLGPLPAMDVARNLAGAQPQLAFVMLAREVTPELLRSALQSGVRDVLSLPLTLETLEEGVRRAATWSQALRERLDDDNLAVAANRVGGRIVAIAGAKGGVGATMLAVQLALAAGRADTESVTCLVDFDLQKGDIRSLLDIPSRRSVLDLAAVSDDLGARSLDETLYVHRSGLRILLAPELGEDAEDLSEVAARRILGALKFQYDLVVVDVGAVVTEAGAVAVELADEVLVVTTPDVPALRAANRVTALWERLNVRREDVLVVLNRVNRESEIQPELARKVLSRPLAERTLPAAYRDLEAALNTGHPERLAQTGLHRAIIGLAQEVGLLTRTTDRRKLRLRAEAGQASIEFTGLITIIFLITALLWQIAIVGYTFVLSGNAAREGARALAVGSDPAQAAKDHVASPWRNGMKVTVSADKKHVTASLPVPVVVPMIHFPGLHVTEKEGTVLESSGSSP